MDQTSNNHSEAGTRGTKNSLAPALAVLDLLMGQWVARCIQVAADLGLPDLLNDGPQCVQALALVTDTHAPTLYRLMRCLASRGIFVETEPDYFAHTELSQVLRSDQTSSIYSIARLYGSEWQWQAWRDLEYSVRTGKSAVEHVYEQKLWEFLTSHPEDAKLFQQAMTGTSTFINTALVQAYDFTSFDTVIDVGGGHGSLLAAVLSASPASRGILFELPQVIDSARKRLSPDAQQRMELVAGDFFATIPEGGDVYLLKQVLHDWNDEDCIRILKTCREAMKPTSKLLVIDAIIGSVSADSTEPSLGELMDLLVLVIHAGRERTVREVASLFAVAGLTLSRVIPTGSPVGIIEGIPN